MYFTAAALHVSGAKVTITDASGAVVDACTNVNGLLQIPSLTVGAYHVQISAPGHATYNQNIEITAGATDNVNAFLPMQVANYNWSVVKSTVTDTYSIQLDATFQTDVPVPVVTVDPPVMEFADLSYGQSKVIDLTMTNNGFIAVNNVSLTLPNPTGYVITPFADCSEEFGAGAGHNYPPRARKRRRRLWRRRRRRRRWWWRRRWWQWRRWNRLRTDESGWGRPDLLPDLWIDIRKHTIRLLLRR
jgi:hypothetical protein